MAAKEFDSTDKPFFLWGSKNNFTEAFFRKIQKVNGASHLAWGLAFFP